MLERAIEDLLVRPRGRPSHAPLVRYCSVQYQAASWDRPRRVIAKVKHQLVCPTCLGRVDKSVNLQEVTDASGKPVDVTRLRSVLVGPNWKFYEWPLEVNRSWSTSGQGFFQNQPQRYNINLIVRTFDDVKTKAGTFKAYKIEQSWSNAYGFRWINTVWYAPEVRNQVKFTTTNSNGTDWELASYSLK